MNFEELGQLLATTPEAPTQGTAVSREYGVPRLTARMALAWKAGWDARPNSAELTELAEGYVELTGPYTVDHLIKASGLDPREWTAEKVITNAWTTTIRVDGNIRQVPNYQTKATLVKIPSAVLTAPRVIAEIPEPNYPPSTQATERVLFVPDMQVGFQWKDNHTVLDPFHNWDVIAAGIQLAADVQPDRIVFLGDNADLPSLSSYSVPPEMKETLSPSLHALHAIYLAFRKACPNAKMEYHLGNHEDRLRRYLVNKAPELKNMRLPNGELAISFERLLDLDKLHVELVGDYGDFRWLWDDLKIHHGNTHATGGGATATKVAKTAAYSECFGHTHKVEFVNKRIETPQGSRLISVWSPGTWARNDLDSPLPRFRKSVDFQHGFGFATRFADTGYVDYQVRNIEDGTIVFGGKAYKGDGADLADWVGGLMGWPQMAKGWAK